MQDPGTLVCSWCPLKFGIERGTLRYTPLTRITQLVPSVLELSVCTSFCDFLIASLPKAIKDWLANLDLPFIF